MIGLLLKHKWLVALVISNMLMLAVLLLLVNRIGGWKYTCYRYKTSDAGVQAMRSEQFGHLPKRAEADNRKCIVMLGDSQVQYCEWAEMINNDSILILNRGISGDHVRGVQARLASVAVQNPDIIFVWVGINDLFYGKSAKELGASYLAMLTDLQHLCPSARVVICTLAPVQKEVRNLPINPQVIRDFNLDLTLLAQSKQFTLLDIYGLLADSQGDLPSDMTLDGVHLKYTAYALIKEQIEKLIRTDQTTHGI